MTHGSGNHIVDVLVSRSRGFAAQGGFDPHRVPVVRPGRREPSLAEPRPAGEARAARRAGRAAAGF